MLSFFNSFFELDFKPFLFDNFVVGTAVKDVCVSVDFVTLAHGYGAGEFFGEVPANFDDDGFRDVLADFLDATGIAFGVAVGDAA